MTVPDSALTTGMPDHAFMAMRPDRSTVIIGCTHAPTLDDLALINALRTNALTVGANG